MRVCVEFDWTDAGGIRLDADGKLVFPHLPRSPGIYRLRLVRGTVESSVYVGETDDLKRRADHYRNPGSRQRTNIRLNGLIRQLLGDGGSAEVAIAQNATVAFNGESILQGLALKAHRRLLESAALVAAMAGGARRVENL